MAKSKNTRGRMLGMIRSVAKAEATGQDHQISTGRAPICQLSYPATNCTRSSNLSIISLVSYRRFALAFDDRSSARSASSSKGRSVSSVGAQMCLLIRPCSRTLTTAIACVNSMQSSSEVLQALFPCVLYAHAPALARRFFLQLVVSASRR